MVSKKRVASRSSRPSPRSRRRTPPPRGFVGRDGSPVLDKYPPRPDAPPPPAPIRVDSPPRARPATVASTESPRAATAGPGDVSPAAAPLIRLDRPFDVDEFASMLGETSVKVQVPRDSLAEVLRRVTEFMGFGIYVYSVTVRPAPHELLKEFVVELQRVDYSPERRSWVPFEEKGATDSPYGPGGPPP